MVRILSRSLLDGGVILHGRSISEPEIILDFEIIITASTPPPKKAAMIST